MSYPLTKLFVVLCFVANTYDVLHSAVFAYDFRRLPTSLQEASFYSVKGSLLQGEKPCIAR